MKSLRFHGMRRVLHVPSDTRILVAEQCIDLNRTIELSYQCLVNCEDGTIVTLTMGISISSFSRNPVLKPRSPRISWILVLWLIGIDRKGYNI